MRIYPYRTVPYLSRIKIKIKISPPQRVLYVCDVRGTVHKSTSIPGTVQYYSMM